MAETIDLVWDEGSDLPINIVYKSGPSGSEAVVNLSNHKLRMDIASPDGVVLTVVNDETITDTDPFTPGNQTDSSYEVVLGTAGQIDITLSRDLTLPNGPFYKYISANPPITEFYYDVFLRDAGNKQKKLVEGTITIKGSVTKWQ